jgi:hypothetical protein
MHVPQFVVQGLAGHGACFLESGRQTGSFPFMTQMDIFHAFDSKQE